MFVYFKEKINAMARHRYAALGLFLYALFEAIVIFVPTDFILASMVALTPTRAQRLALVATIGSVTGAMLIYFVGGFAFDALAVPVMNFLCLHADIACSRDFIPHIQAAFAQYGFLLVAMSIALSFIPRRLIALVAGMGHMPLLPFVAASFLGRWLRYAIVAELVKRYGETATLLFRKNMAVSLLLSGVILLLVFGGIVYF